MAVSLSLSDLTIEEKLRLMEELWADLSRNAESVASPEWHQAELQAREERIASGEVKFKDWETAKADLRKRLT